MLNFLSKRAYRKLEYTGLDRWGIKSKNQLWNSSVPELYEQAVRIPIAKDFHTESTILSSTGALVAYSGLRTGRSPKDKRIVMDNTTKNEIWWGDVNIPISTETNRFSRDLAIKFLNTEKNLYITDGYAGWDPKYRIKVRVVSGRPYHALFMKNMLIKPTEEELEKDFLRDENVDFHIFNAGELLAPLPIEGINTSTSVQVNFTDKTQIILGSQYAGEMKKGVFGVMHYYMPKKGVVSLHASATEGKDKDVTIYFGLSGTGKTTLSADPKRFMLGDDEHCWSDDGVFNIEGGCYAKAINLTQEQEPDIFNAIKFGTVLENVRFKKANLAEREVDFTNIELTENTRVCYPLEHISNAKFPSSAGHAKNIIFLTCDAFGVLPPISRLNPNQTMYHFISGYTAKVAGTEMGIKDPEPTFSACFGAAFLPLHPTLYAKMLAEKLKTHGANAWLINTGWSGGKFGVGQRMKLSVTRKIIDAIHNGDLKSAEWEQFPFFNFEVPKAIPGVDQNILNPRNTWKDKDAYDTELKQLAARFANNFQTYKAEASKEIQSGGPC